MPALFLLVTCVYLRGNFRVRCFLFDHSTQVSMQVRCFNFGLPTQVSMQLTCDYLGARLVRALNKPSSGRRVLIGFFFLR